VAIDLATGGSRAAVLPGADARSNRCPRSMSVSCSARAIALSTLSDAVTAVT
jgi:hypothetical protein